LFATVLQIDFRVSHSIRARLFVCLNVVSVRPILAYWHFKVSCWVHIKRT